MIPGQYVTVPGGGFFGAAIRLVTRAPVAHAVLYIGDRPNGQNVVEAGPAGIAFGHRDFEPRYWPSQCPLTSEQGNSIAETGYMLAHRGTEYNFLSDFYLGMREGLKFTLPKMLFKMASTSKHLQCAQLVDYCYLVNGVHLFKDGRSPGAVSPADLWRLDYDVKEKVQW